MCGPHSLSPLWPVPLRLAGASEVAPCLLQGGHGPYFHFSLGHLRQTSDGPETKLVLDPNILMSSFYRTCCLEYFVTGFMIVICFFYFHLPPTPPPLPSFFGERLLALVDGYFRPTSLPLYTYCSFVLGLIPSPSMI